MPDKKTDHDKTAASVSLLGVLAATTGGNLGQLAANIAALTARLEEIEARLGIPPMDDARIAALMPEIERIRDGLMVDMAAAGQRAMDGAAADATTDTGTRA